MNNDLAMELLCVVIALTGLYLYLTSNFTYWLIRHVKTPPALPFFGSFKDVSLGRVLMSDYLKKLYNKYSPNGMVGLYAGSTPILLITDPDLMKDVLIKDFAVFADRGLSVDEEVDAFGSSIFSLKPDKWRVLRNKLSPIFSTGKLKDMFYIVMECGNHFQEHLDQLVGEERVVDCCRIATKFTSAVIGTCAFGLDLNTLDNEDCEFLRRCRQIFKPPFKVVIGEIMKSYVPWLYKRVGKHLIDTEVRDYFTKLIMGTLHYRKQRGITRHDFVDVLRDIKEHPEEVPELDLSDKFITAQAVIFFVAGFHSSSLTIAHSLYELAKQPTVQDRVRQEIKQELEKNKGVLDYQLIRSNLVYLDAVIKETLRKYPPVIFLTRKAARPYRFTGTKVVIPKGQSVWIPVYAFHQDPNIYPSPELFDPDRFMNNGAEPSHQIAYLPFGDGPRNCIGARFAENQTKLGLLTILLNYKVDVCEKTKLVHTCAIRHSLLMPVGGIYVRMTKIGQNL